MYSSRVETLVSSGQSPCWNSLALNSSLVAENLQFVEWFLWSYQPKGLPGLLSTCIILLYLTYQNTYNSMMSLYFVHYVLFNNGLCISSTVLNHISHFLICSIPMKWPFSILHPAKVNCAKSAQSWTQPILGITSWIHLNAELSAPCLSFPPLGSSSSKLHNFQQPQSFIKYKIRSSKK